MVRVIHHPGRGHSARRPSLTRAGGCLLTVLAALTGSACSAGDVAAADRAAASFADGPLTTELRQVVARSNRSPVEAITGWLADPPAEFRHHDTNASWVIHHASPAAVTVAVYYDDRDTTFTQSQAWGLACRTFRVEAGVVQSHADTCPDHTPRTPPADAIGGAR